MNPDIFLKFDVTGCGWISGGWKDDHSLMTKARDAIRKGKDKAEVIKLLKDAGFDVHVQDGEF